MSDILDTIRDVLVSIEEPAFRAVLIGRPRSIMQSRTAAIWWIGLQDDETQTHGLDCVGRTENIQIYVYWRDEDAAEVRESIEHDIRATCLAVSTAIHTNITLGGIIDSLWMAETRGDPYTQLSGITYRVAIFELRAMVLSAMAVGG